MPDDLIEELDAVAEDSPYFDNRSDVLRAAARTFLEEQEGYRDAT